MAIEIDREVTHSLGQAEALQRIKGLLERLQREHADKVSIEAQVWQGHRGQFRVNILGYLIQGRIMVLDDKVKFRGGSQLAPDKMQSQVDDLLHQQVEKLLA